MSLSAKPNGSSLKDRKKQKPAVKAAVSAVIGDDGRTNPEREPHTLVNESRAVAMRDIPYQPHPAASLFPPMDTAMSSALTQSIGSDGLIHEIVLYQGQILDGRARYDVCIELGITPRFRDFDPAYEGDPVRFVLNSNLVRKHWQPGQLSMIAAKLVNSKLGFNQQSEGTTFGAAAAFFGLSRRSVERAKEILDSHPDIAVAVEEGKLSVGLANTVSTLPKEKQKSILALPHDRKKLKREIDKAIKAERADRSTRIPDGRFSVIVSDPAWEVDRTPYATMPVGEIDIYHRNLLQEKAAEDCHLFLWTTQAFLPAALKLIDKWGWKYQCTMVWRKNGGHKHPDRPRYNAEFVLVATKGSPQYTNTTDFPACFDGEWRDHSQKPDEFFTMIERVTLGPRLELFARQSHYGFDPHGDQIELSDHIAPSLSPEESGSELEAEPAAK